MPDDVAIRIEPGPFGSEEVVVTGEIDMATAARFRALLREAAAGRSPLVVNLTAVEYLDSAGVAVLFDQARQGELEVILGPGCLVGPVVTVSRLADVATVRLREPN